MSLKQCTNNKKSTLPFKARLPCLAQNLYTYCERVTTVQTRMSSKQIFSIWLATADQTSLTDIPPGRETARVCTSPFLINRCPCLPFNFQIGQSNSRLTIISITCSTIWGTEVNIVALYKKKKSKSSRHYSSASRGGGWGREKQLSSMKLVEKSGLFILVPVREIPGHNYRKWQKAGWEPWEQGYEVASSLSSWWLIAFIVCLKIYPI